MSPMVIFFGIGAACASIFTGLLYWSHWDTITGKNDHLEDKQDKVKSNK